MRPAEQIGDDLGHLGEGERVGTGDLVDARGSRGAPRRGRRPRPRWPRAGCGGHARSGSASTGRRLTIRTSVPKERRARPDDHRGPQRDELGARVREQVLDLSPRSEVLAVFVLAADPAEIDRAPDSGVAARSHVVLGRDTVTFGEALAPRRAPSNARGSRPRPCPPAPGPSEAGSSRSASTASARSASPRRLASRTRHRSDAVSRSAESNWPPTKPDAPVNRTVARSSPSRVGVTRSAVPGRGLDRATMRVPRADRRPVSRFRCTHPAAARGSPETAESSAASGAPPMNGRRCAPAPSKGARMTSRRT